MGRRGYCDDWSCPARASCARHFGRSEAYWAMRQESGPFFKGKRKKSRDHCDDYRADRIRPWMLEAFQQPAAPEGRWRMPLFVRVGSW
jgi:hypothetical protein